MEVSKGMAESLKESGKWSRYSEKRYIFGVTHAVSQKELKFMFNDINDRQRLWRSGLPAPDFGELFQAFPRRLVHKNEFRADKSQAGYYTEGVPLIEVRFSGNMADRLAELWILASQYR